MLRSGLCGFRLQPEGWGRRRTEDAYSRQNSDWAALTAAMARSPARRQHRRVGIRRSDFALDRRDRRLQACFERVQVVAAFGDQRQRAVAARRPAPAATSAPSRRRHPHRGQRIDARGRRSRRTPASAPVRTGRARAGRLRVGEEVVGVGRAGLERHVDGEAPSPRPYRSRRPRRCPDRTGTGGSRRTAPAGRRRTSTASRCRDGRRYRRSRRGRRRGRARPRRRRRRCCRGRTPSRDRARRDGPAAAPARTPARALLSACSAAWTAAPAARPRSPPTPARCRCRRRASPPARQSRRSRRGSRRRGRGQLVAGRRARRRVRPPRCAQRGATR